MTDVSPIPEGFPSISPYIMVSDLQLALDFYQEALNAKIIRQEPDAEGKIRGAEIRIGSSPVMMGEHPTIRVPQPTWENLPAASLYIYVDDADTTQSQAIAAGATELAPVSLKYYGNREGGIIDPFGILWWIATQVEVIPPEELQARAKQSQKS